MDGPPNTPWDICDDFFDPVAAGIRSLLKRFHKHPDGDVLPPEPWELEILYDNNDMAMAVDWLSVMANQSTDRFEHKLRDPLNRWKNLHWRACRVLHTFAGFEDKEPPHATYFPQVAIEF